MCEVCENTPYCTYIYKEQQKPPIFTKVQWEVTIVLLLPPIECWAFLSSLVPVTDAADRPWASHSLPGLHTAKGEPKRCHKVSKRIMMMVEIGSKPSITFPSPTCLPITYRLSTYGPLLSYLFTLLSSISLPIIYHESILYPPITCHLPSIHLHTYHLLYIYPSIVYPPPT